MIVVNSLYHTRQYTPLPLILTTCDEYKIKNKDPRCKIGKQQQQKEDEEKIANLYLSWKKDGDGEMDRGFKSMGRLPLTWALKKKKKRWLMSDER